MDKERTETAHTDNIFWPKWQIKFDDGKVHPHRFGGVHLGPMPKQASKISEQPNSSHRSFSPPLDMLFIDNYIFKYYEHTESTIIFDKDPNLWQLLSEVEKVAINASSLSESKEKDDIWLKKLRFILRFFPKIRAITVLTAVVLDLASPASIQRPMCFMDIGNTSIGDRMRHGILAGDDLKMIPHDPVTLRPSDFAIQEWDTLPSEWPAFGKLKVDGTAPELYMGTMVFFGKEWIGLNSASTPGETCALGRRSGDPMAAVIWREIGEGRGAEVNIRTRSRRDLKKKPSMLSLKEKGSRLALLRKASTFSLRSQSSKDNLKGQKTCF